MKTKLLTTLILAAGLFLGLMHSLAYAGGITVTTTADSDAADSDCSLREAIVAANTDAAYNGCSAGAYEAQNIRIIYMPIVVKDN